MKAITLTQPWASLVAIGAKRIETRAWSTAYRGPLAIHAAKGLGPVGGNRGLRALVTSEPFFTALADITEHTPQRSLVDAIIDALPLGAIVALCNLADSVSLTAANGKAYRRNRYTPMWVGVPEPEALFGDYSPGRWGLLLSDTRALSAPIPTKGALGLWEWQPPEGLAP